MRLDLVLEIDDRGDVEVGQTGAQLEPMDAVADVHHHRSRRVAGDAVERHRIGNLSHSQARPPFG